MAPESMLADYTGVSGSFFNNLRVPAALLATSAVRDAYALTLVPPANMQQFDREHGIDASRSWRALRYTYLLLMVIVLALELNVIFLATQVTAQLATKSFDARAESLVALLEREFEFEYVAVRFHFVTGLLLYVIGQGLRVRYQLRRYTQISYSAMLVLFATAAGMLTYHNSQTISYGGFTSLLKRHVDLSFTFIGEHILGSKKSPVMALVTLVASLASFAFAVASVVKREFDHSSFGWHAQQNEPVQQEPEAAPLAPALAPYNLPDPR